MFLLRLAFLCGVSLKIKFLPGMFCNTNVFRALAGVVCENLMRNQLTTFSSAVLSLKVFGWNVPGYWVSFVDGRAYLYLLHGIRGGCLMLSRI